MITTAHAKSISQHLPPPTASINNEEDEFWYAASLLLTSEQAVRVSGHQARVLLDCGSSHNLMSRRFAQERGFPLLHTGSQISVQFANETTVLEDMTKVEAASVAFMGDEGGRVEAAMNFFLSDALGQYDVILGVPCLAQLSRHNKLKMKFHRNAISLRSAHGPRITITLNGCGDRVHAVPRATVMARHVEFVSDNHAPDTEAGGMEAATRAEFKDLFTPLDGHAESRLPHKIAMSFRAGLRPTTPVRYGVSPGDYDTLAETIKDLLARGIIEKSSSRFAAPAFLVNKDGLDAQGRQRKRLVVDFRRVNDALEDAPATFAPLRAEDMARSLAQYEYFSTIDLKDGYYVTEINPEDRDYAAFSTATGTYRYRRAPMGLKLSATAFQANLNHVLHDIMLRYPGQVHVFVDDVSVAADSLENNRIILHEVLHQLRAFNIKANEGKLQLYRKRVTFLGYSVSKGAFGLQDRANKAGDIPAPRSRTEVRSFTSFLNYFRSHINNLAGRAEPLYQLQRKEVPFRWGTREEAAFRDLKLQLGKLSTLSPPSRALHPYHVLYTDASAVGIAGHLCEDVDGKLQPLGFFSEALPPGASTWSIEERELLAATRSLSHFEHLICNGSTKILCDCRPLVMALNKNRIDSDRARRLVAKLLDHNVTVVHHEGSSNRADFGSRQFPPPAASDTWRPTRAEVNARWATRTSELALGTLPPQGPIESWTLSLDNNVWRQAYEEDPMTKDIVMALTGAHAADSPWRGVYEVAQSGMVYLIPHAGSGDGKRLYVPASLRQNILTACHDSHAAGHAGTSRTLRRVLPLFFWPDCRRQIQKYVRGCLTCAKCKPFTAPPGPAHPIEIPPTPYAAISMDLVTALPRASAYFDNKMQQVDSVLTVCDLLTHFVHFFAVPKSITGLQVASILIRDIFTPQCAVPTKIVSDRDPRWTSAVVAAVMSALGTRLALSTSHSPTTNGVAEAKNKHLGTYLKTVGGKAEAWPSLLGTCALAYNSAFCASIGMSPAEARFGHVTRFPFEVEIGEGKVPDPLRDLQRTQEMVLACAKDTLRSVGDKTIGERSRRRYSSGSLKAGDEVLVHSSVLLPPGKHVINRKVSPRFLGPYKVVRKISSEAYEIQLPAKSRAHKTISTRFLRPFEHTHLLFPNRPKPDSDARAEALMDYIVDKILAHKGKGKALRFKVRWLGYPDDQSTWEPMQNFIDDDGHLANEELSKYLYDRDMFIP